MALQSGLTLKVLELMKLSRSAIARFGIFLGFVGSFFLALANTTYVLLIGKFSHKIFVIVGKPSPIHV